MIEDASNIFSLSSDERLVKFSFTGSTGTSISISFIEVYGNATPAATGPKYQHFDNTRRILGRQNYNSFGGGQMVTFG